MLGPDVDVLAAPEILRVENLTKCFRTRRTLFGHDSAAVLRAVDGVSFSLTQGETLGVVGESGCGKSTMARSIVRLLKPTSGRVIFEGKDITTASVREMGSVWRGMQYVFQDPYASLDPRMRVREIVAEPLRIHRLNDKAWRNERVAELLDQVGLSREHGRRYPHEFSGGQRQRIGLARALALNPRLLILDEPVSALDVSIQAQVINLLQELQAELGLSYIIIAHNLAVVRHISHRIAVMYLGKIVELGDKRDIYEYPAHPYTQALLSAVPVPDPARRGESRRVVLQGDAPSPLDPPSGCRFRTRCFKAQALCAREEPMLELRMHGRHPTACHFAEAPPWDRVTHEGGEPSPSSGRRAPRD